MLMTDERLNLTADASFPFTSKSHSDAYKAMSASKHGEASDSSPFYSRSIGFSIVNKRTGGSGLKEIVIHYCFY